MFTYKDNQHQTIGPVSEDEIRRLISEGTITRNSLLSKEGGNFWQPAYRFEEFEGLLNDTSESAQSAQPPLDIDATVEPEPTDVPNQQQSSGPDVVKETEEPAQSDSEPEKASANSGQAAEEEQAREPVHYAFIGGDGREYGPVTAEQLRSWVRQRRADRNSRVRPDGASEWTTMGALSEFDSVFQEQAREQSASPPPLDSIKANKIAEEIIQDGYDLNISDCFSRSWKLYTENFPLLTGITALVILILAVLNSMAGVGSAVSIALGGVFFGGLAHAFLKLIRGKEATVYDTFDGFNRCFVPLLIASILTSVLVSVGLVFCILPGIYLFVAWLFVFPLVHELRMDFWPAMELSRRVVHERWWELFGLTVVIFALTFVGLLLFGVGVFISTPIAVGTIMYAYEDIFKKYSEESSDDPAQLK